MIKRSALATAAAGTCLVALSVALAGPAAAATNRQVHIAANLSAADRNARRVCRTVVLRLRFGDFTRATRSHTLGQPTSATFLNRTADAASAATGSVTQVRFGRPRATRR